MNLSDRKYSLLYLILVVIFATCLIISNLVEIKTIPIGWLTITGGLLVFPISYIINDCVSEVYGFGKAKLMIWMGFLANLAVTVMLQIVMWLPGTEEWTSQEAMEVIYGSVPRILIASYIAFVCGSMVNAFTMTRMKQNAARQIAATGEKARYNLRFALRAIVSTIFGEGVDSIIFFPIAFGGVLSWELVITLVASQTVIKTVYEIIVLPLTIQVVKLLKKAEGME